MALEELRAEIAACRKAFKASVRFGTESILHNPAEKQSQLKCLIVIDASVQEGLKLLHSINKDVVEVKELAVVSATSRLYDRGGAC